MKILYYILLSTYLLNADNSQQLNLSGPDVKKLGRDWYQANAFVDFHKDITQGQAEKSAVNLALKKIIEKHSGIEISSNSLSISAETNLEIQTDHFSQFINTMSKGIILEKEVLESSIVKLLDRDVYSVRVKARVGELKGERDPLFKLEAKLNRDQYQSGDEMIIDIYSSKDCYVYIFNILADGTVGVLLPNEYIDDNFLKAGGMLILPSERDRKRGIKYKVGLLPDKKEDTEMIMILAIKSGGKKDFKLDFGDRKLALKELQSWIIDFPRDMIEQVNRSYLIQ